MALDLHINVGKTIINHPPVITIFIGGSFTIPSHGWYKWHCFSQIILNAMGKLSWDYVL